MHADLKARVLASEERATEAEAQALQAHHAVDAAKLEHQAAVQRLAAAQQRIHDLEQQLQAERSSSLGLEGELQAAKEARERDEADADAEVIESLLELQARLEDVQQERDAARAASAEATQRLKRESRQAAAKVRNLEMAQTTLLAQVEALHTQLSSRTPVLSRPQVAAVSADDDSGEGALQDAGLTDASSTDDASAELEWKPTPQPPAGMSTTESPTASTSHPELHVSRLGRTRPPHATARTSHALHVPWCGGCRVLHRSSRSLQMTTLTGMQLWRLWVTTVCTSCASVLTTLSTACGWLRLPRGVLALS